MKKWWCGWGLNPGPFTFAVDALILSYRTTTTDTLQVRQMRWKMKSFNFRCKRTINIEMIAKVLKFAFKNTSVQNWSDASTTIAISTYWIVRIECTYLIYLLTESTDHSYCIGWLHKKTARWLYLMTVHIELALQLYTLLVLTVCTADYTCWLYLLTVLLNVLLNVLTDCTYWKHLLTVLTHFTY